MSQNIENKILSIIYGNGKGWTFSQKDFVGLGTRSAIDVALHRLHNKGTIRRVIRGIYDYPKISEKLRRTLSPDVDQVAQALARKFGWRIQPTGASAMNLLGLSAQVPGRIAYLSDGPNRRYTVGKQVLEFQHTALKEAGFKLRESSLIVQGLKLLGQGGITPDLIGKLRKQFSAEQRSRILRDTRTANGWIHDTILRICREEP